MLSATKINVGHYEKAKQGASFCWKGPGRLLRGGDVEGVSCVGVSRRRKGLQAAPGQQSPGGPRPCFMWATDGVCGTVHHCSEVSWTEG